MPNFKGHKKYCFCLVAHKCNFMLQKLAHNIPLQIFALIRVFHLINDETNGHNFNVDNAPTKEQE